MLIPFRIMSKFQSTPPARGATFIPERHRRPIKDISIHAPREGGDRCPMMKKLE